MSDYPFIRDYCRISGSSHQWLTAELQRARRMHAPADAWSFEGYPFNRWRRVSQLQEHAPYRHSLVHRDVLPAEAWDDAETLKRLLASMSEEVAS